MRPRPARQHVHHCSCSFGPRLSRKQLHTVLVAYVCVQQQSAQTATVDYWIPSNCWALLIDRIASHRVADEVASTLAEEGIIVAKLDATAHPVTANRFGVRRIVTPRCWRVGAVSHARVPAAILLIKYAHINVCQAADRQRACGARTPNGHIMLQS